MKYFPILVGLFLVLVQADENSWSSFQIKYNKVYRDQTEQDLRQKIFNENLEIFEEHNKKYQQGLVSYKLGVNEFSDLTSKEFAAKFTPYETQQNILQSGRSQNYFTNDGTKTIPQSIDWSTRKAVTEVKNQGNCRASWAFSAVATIESQLAVQTGELKTLSEQELIDCDTRNYGCDGGGTVQRAIDYVTSNGLTSEANYPYRAVKGMCSASNTQNIAVRTKSYVRIERNETLLKEIVGLIGPVSVAVHAIPLESYTGGIFDGECSIVVNQGVLLVGYGTDDATGTDYWILKNSWGTEWGEKGYFRLKMGSNLCGITIQAGYPILDFDNSGYVVRSGLILYLFSFIYLFKLVLY